MQALCKAATLAGVSHRMCEKPLSHVLQKKFVEHMNDHGLSYGTKEEF